LKEIGIVNREIARIVSEQGHQDFLMVVDAGFAIPKNVEVVDVSIAENKPMVLEVLAELKKFYSVEKMILAIQTKKSNPTLFRNISSMWGEGMEVEEVDHAILKKKANEVKAVIRTGDFTAYGNVILVSGAGDRWYMENKI
jgi:D-ribose pyranase